MITVDVPNEKKDLNNVLVVLEWSSDHSQLIQRAQKIAQAFDSYFYVVFFEFEGIGREYQDELIFMIKGVILNCEKYGASASYFKIYKNDKEFYKHFDELLKELSISQIIMAGEVESRMNEIFFGSTKNRLAKNYPDHDFYYISPVNKQWDYSIGIKAYLNPTDDKLTFSSEKYSVSTIEGIFFKKMDTDFDNGIFRFYDNDVEKEYIIVDAYRKK